MYVGTAELPRTARRKLTRGHGTGLDARRRASWLWRRTCERGGHGETRAGLVTRADRGLAEVTFAGRESMQVSHEAIYRTLFSQSRRALKRELVGHLHSRRMMRRGRTATRSGRARGQIIGAVSIRERPAEVEDLAVPGHWEGDMISGASNTHIATLVERSSRLTVLVKPPGKDAPTVARAVARKIRQLPADLRRTLTWDLGPEMAQHRSFSVATNVQVYFCDPQSPWQRGTNENTNRLLRQGVGYRCRFASAPTVLREATRPWPAPRALPEGTWRGG